MEPIHVLRTGFLGAASAVFLSNSIPALRTRFLVYGPRGTKVADGKTGLSPKPQGSTSSDATTGLLDSLSAFQVPHSWFFHFYIVSVLSSAFWAIQILLNGPAVALIQSWSPPSSENAEGSMTRDQVIFVWALMACQGFRRLYESIVLTKKSNSQMAVLHWLVGISFYAAMGIAVWIEGLSALPDIRAMRPSIDVLSFINPSLRGLLSLCIFTIASGVQYDVHCYLASLKKYTLPKHPIFNVLICPHYTAEVLIYISLAFAAAPEGSMLNKTLLTALVFVAVNLGVTADNSRTFYAEKFGADKVADKWRMLPFLY